MRPDNLCLIRAPTAEGSRVANPRNPCCKKPSRRRVPHQRSEPPRPFANSILHYFSPSPYDPWADQLRCATLGRPLAEPTNRRSQSVLNPCPNRRRQPRSESAKSVLQKPSRRRVPHKRSEPPRPFANSVLHYFSPSPYDPWADQLRCATLGRPLAEPTNRRSQSVLNPCPNRRRQPRSESAKSVFQKTEP